MKKINKIIFLAIAISIASKSYSQNLNWENLQPGNRHLVNINAGGEYGVVFGAGYGYQLKTKLPTVLNIAFSTPAGEDLLDDYKIKVGGQVKLYKIRNFVFSANVYGVFRRYKNPLVRMLNFGSDLSGVIGYYKPKWFVAGEAGFDKAIVTNFKSSDLQKEIYPLVQDGWYQPATGGNFYYGIQAGVAMKQSEFTLSLGKIIEQDFKTSPFLPFYFRLGYTLKLGKAE